MSSFSPIQPPPRLLLGAATLFWGAMVGLPILGFIIAVIIECANWIRFRWNFGTPECALAWKICMLLILLTGTFIWLDTDRISALPKLLTWLPALVLPLQFVQSYGLINSIPLNCFSFFTSLHQKRNIRLGLAPALIHFNFGNAYLAITLIAATLGKNADGHSFLPGLVILVAWLAFARIKTRPITLTLVMLLAGGLAFGGQIGLQALYKWATNRSFNPKYSSPDLSISKTSMGSLGELKQSPEMLWRLKPTNTERSPKLLRLAFYNYYRGVTWRTKLPPSPTPLTEESAFQELRSVELTPGTTTFLFRADTEIAKIPKNLPTYSIRGAASKEAPLPLPGSAADLKGFALDGIEQNPLGTVRIFPKKSIIEGSVRYQTDSPRDQAPFANIDLEIDPTEAPVIQKITQDLALNTLPTSQQKAARIHQYLHSNFTYSRHLAISQNHVRTHYNTTPLASFLTREKQGHCEFFATAATLLLRASGVPARYCIGFAITERDPKRGEYIIRGTHAHAWTRFWDEEAKTWRDLDATPGTWHNVEALQTKNSTWFSDAFQRLREDFFLWRNRPANRTLVLTTISILGLIIFTFIAYRLWKSKVTPAKSSPYTYQSTPSTALHRLEKPLKRLLGPREPHQTYANWLAALKNHNIPPNQLNEAIQLHQIIRFDPVAPPPTITSRLESLTKTLAKHLK